MSIEQSTLGMVAGEPKVCSMLAEGAGAAGGGCCGPGGLGRAQLMSAVTDIVGLSFFATLDMATHEHPHITALHLDRSTSVLHTTTRLHHRNTNLLILTNR